MTHPFHPLYGCEFALVTGPGSRWDLTDTLTVGEGRPGHLQITDGGVVAAQSVIVGSDGLVNGAGGTILVGASSVQNGGVLAPGTSPGTMTVDGNYEQLPGGILEIEIGGLAAQSEYDVLVVTGNADFDGTIQLKFIDGFAPHAGDQFDFLQVGGALTATGASYEIRNLEPGFEFDVAFDAGGLTMTARTDGVFVPEPGTMAILLSGLALLVICSRHRR